MIVALLIAAQAAQLFIDVPNEPIACTVPDFHRLFVLESRTDKNLAGVKITADRNLVDVFVDGRLEPQGFSMPKQTQRLVDLWVRNVEVGAFTVALTMTARGIQQVRLVKFNCTLTPSAVEISGLAPVRREPGDVPVQFFLRDIRQASITIDPPAIVALARKVGGGTEQARITSLVLHKDQEMPAPDKLGAGAAERFEVRLRGLETPGEYAGTLRVGGHDLQPVEQAVQIFVKRSWYCALLVIMLGAGVAFVTRSWFKGRRPRLVLMRRLARESASLSVAVAPYEPLAETEREVVEALSRRAEALSSALDLGAVEMATDVAIDGICAAMLLCPVWLRARRSASLLANPSKYHPEISNARLMLLDGGRAAPDYGAELGTLQGLLPQMATDRRVELQERIALLRRLLPGNVPAATALGDADRKLNTDDLGGAVKAISQVQFDYLRDAATAAKAKLPAQAPPAVPQATWDEVVARIQTALDDVVKARDGEAAFQRYGAFLDVYLAGLSRALTAAQKSAEAGQIDKAREERRYDDAIAVWNNAIASMHAVGAPPGAPAPSISATPLAATPVGGVLPPDLQSQRRKERMLTNELDRVDFVFNVVAAALGAAGGLGILYFPNATWGTVPDILAALLWGAGLQGAAGAGFEGIAGMRDKLSK